MSCDGNRGKFFHHIAQDQAVQDTFGSLADAEAAFEQIFNTARAQARPGNVPMRAQAEAHTRKLFDEMRSLEIKPPTHSPSGLPRKDAQFGYAAVHQTLDAIRGGKRLPSLAHQVAKQRQHTRRISAVREDTGGYFRCGNCGRFASRTKAHICPATANRQTLEAHLHRRLGLPASAYAGSLDEVLAEARANGVVRMRHGMTGETIEASLDGLPLALTTGFAPESWSQAQTALVELPGGRVLPVLNPTGLQQIHPAGDALATAGAAYGLVVQPGTAVASATSIPSIPHHTIASSAATDVSGGQVYDLGHFIGTEYRKRDTLGTDIDVNGVRYTIGDRSKDQADWSSARHAGLEPPPKGGVAVGRTLVEAVGILSTGQVVETADGHIQVYDPKRENLLAVYDPGTGVAGDTDGTPNASAAQMAAVLAHHALHPQNQYDAALATDLVRARTGAGTPLAAADSGYIALKDSLGSGKTLTLGGAVSAGRCPDCGQFMGDAHVCPAGVAQPIPVGTSVFSSPPPITIQPQIDVQVDTTPIADALKNAPPAQVQVDAHLDADTFAQAVQKGLANINIPAPASQSAVSAKDVADLRQAMTQMAQAVETLAKNGGSREVRVPERLVEVTERLAASVAGAGILPAQDRSTGSARCPKCGQFMDQDHTCPPRQPRVGRPVSDAAQASAQEHILAPLTLPAPDPYLLNVPENVGGQLQQPLAEFIPTVDPNFEINEQGEKILRTMSAAMQLGAGKEKSNWTRAFGLYGPPGTGKNTIARQLAASIKTVDTDGNITQGMNYTEANITPEFSMQELIGTTVLENDPNTGATISRTKLGKIGLAAAMGSVICVNEIVRNPKLATALQSMIEDGEIQLDSPEQGLIRIPVHPSTVFVMTWNPGYEGDAERPGQAPLSRIMPLKMDRPSADEQTRRVESFFAAVRGEAAEVDSIGARRREITAQNYAVPASITPAKEEITASVRFFNEIGALTGGGIGERQVGLNSDTSTAPGQRELNRFVALGKTIGWNDALETLKVVCDQDDQFESQWSLIRERFEVHFGADGKALNRQAPSQN